MITWDEKDVDKIYDVLSRAMYSDNTDYIVDQLSEIYRMIVDNNIGLENVKYTRLDKVE